MPRRFDPPAPPYVGPPKNHSGNGNKPINRIVVHGTVSPTQRGGARAIARLFTDGKVRGSAHYVVDPGETVQAAWDSVVCWHAPPNRNSIGIELCDWVGDPKTGKPLPLSRWDDRDHTLMLRRAAALAGDLCLAYDLPAVMLTPAQLRAGKRGICEHDDVSKAFGQSSHWDLGAFPRRRFIRLVRAHMARRRGDTTEAAREEKKADTRITRARDLLEAAARAARGGVRRRRINAGLNVLPEA